MSDALLATRLYGTCEYFDLHHGDCLNSFSPRFQTTADQSCNAWAADTTTPQEERND